MNDHDPTGKVRITLEPNELRRADLVAADRYLAAARERGDANGLRDAFDDIAESFRQDGTPPDEIELVLAHLRRFHKVSIASGKSYVYFVACAYDDDLAAAALDSDEQVAARVVAFERSHGEETRDWPAIVAAERGDPVNDNRTERR